nr:hypothetical protein 14 [Deltaproteobacteria bacterium]
MNPEQLRHLVMRVLVDAGLYTVEAQELLMMTAAVESHCGQYIRQFGGGPALGIFQMEPATMQDIFTNFLVYRPELKALVEPFSYEQPLLALEASLPFQILMTRIHYMRFKDPLPEYKTSMNYVGGFREPTQSWRERAAEYWKLYYNTPRGKGTSSKAVEAYETFCLWRNYK